MRASQLGAGATFAVMVAACGHAQSIVGPGTGTQVDEVAATATATTPATAQVDGRFRIVGGAYPGVNHPLSGTITVHKKSANGTVVTSAKAVDGTFSLQLAPGRYVFVGTTPEMRGPGQGCTSGQPVRVRTATINHVTVQCDVP